VSRKKYRLVTALGSLLTVCLLAFAFLIPPRLHRYECRRHLSSIHYTLLEYASEHDGRLPSSLSKVSGKGRKVVFMCPSADHETPGGTATVDYGFIAWPKLRKKPDMPVVFDGTLANHGTGVNVLMLSGRTFWDSHAEFLTTFFGEYPEVSWTYGGKTFTGVGPR
jgi:hypothetical protein